MLVGRFQRKLMGAKNEQNLINILFKRFLALEGSSCRTYSHRSVTSLYINKNKRRNSKKNISTTYILLQQIEEN